MVVGGLFDERGLKDTQLVDLSSSKICGNLKPYPIAIYGATGALVSENPVICGGFQRTGNQRKEQKECQMYNKSSNTWKFLTNMATEKAYLASVPLNGQLFVTGGSSKEKFEKLSITEFVSLNGEVTPGPPLPSPRFKHCMVVLPDGKVMIIGGGSPNNKKSVMMFDPDSKKFNESIYEDLIDEAWGAGCAVFNSPGHGNRPVVLSVGGKQNDAEVYDYTKPNAVWTKSND